MNYFDGTLEVEGGNNSSIFCLYFSNNPGMILGSLTAAANTLFSNSSVSNLNPGQAKELHLVAYTC